LGVVGCSSFVFVVRQHRRPGMRRRNRLTPRPSGRLRRRLTQALALSEEVVKSRRLLASLTGLALLLVSVSAQAIKPPMPRSKAQLAGVWVGPDAWGSVLRLELNSEGQGLLVVRDLDSKGDLALYKVELAKININDLSFSVSPISNGAARIALSGTNDSNAINLVRYLKDFGDGYGVHALLIRQSDLQSGLRDLKAAGSKLPAQPAR